MNFKFVEKCIKIQQSTVQAFIRTGVYAVLIFCGYSVPCDVIADGLRYFSVVSVSVTIDRCSVPVLGIPISCPSTFDSF